LTCGTINVHINRLAAVDFAIFASEADPSLPNLEGISSIRIFCKETLTGWFAVKLGLTPVVFESLEIAMFKNKQNKEQFQVTKLVVFVFLSMPHDAPHDKSREIHREIST
jgi:hypothetical protein